MNRLGRSFVFLMFFICLASAGAGETSRRVFSVTITLDKKVYVRGEPFTGEVVIFNAVPAVVPKTFFISLYHEGRLVDGRTTAVPKVFFGENTYTFEAFGIPAVTDFADSAGRWTLIIKETAGSGPGVSAREDFEVVLEQKKAGS